MRLRRIERGIRSGRGKGDERCENCQFWSLLVSVREDSYGKPMGNCRRLPPSPSLGAWHYEVLKALYEVVEPGVEPDAGWPFEAQQCSWPVTTQNDWCGEFKGKRR
jgi:hypothetical protein